MTRLLAVAIICAAAGSLIAAREVDSAIAQADERIAMACIQFYPDSAPYCERVPGVNNGRVEYFAPKP